MRRLASAEVLALGGAEPLVEFGPAVGAEDCARGGLHAALGAVPSPGSVAVPAKLFLGL